MTIKALIYISLAILVFMFCINPTPTHAQDLSEFNKETIVSIREVTFQLILISMGVFVLLGGFVATENRTFTNRYLIWPAILLLVLSIVAGLFTYGNLIFTLAKSQFDPFGAVKVLATLQWIFFGLGGFIFAIFVLLNIRGQ